MPLAFPVISIFVVALFAIVNDTNGEDPEYQNPEIQLKFNLKEDAESLTQQNKMPDEPEGHSTGSADYDQYPFFRSNRQPVKVGTWTSLPAEFDVSINIETADIWWVGKDPDYEADCEWTFYIHHNDQEVSDNVETCSSSGDELVRETYNVGTTIDLVTGDTFALELWYEGWEDVDIYHDNVPYDTGLNVKGNHLILFGGRWENTTVTMEFAEAWPTDWNTNLDAEYIMVTGDDGYMADNTGASVRDGNEHAFQGNNSTMEVNSTMIEWTEITGTGLKIMMDYTVFDHTGNSSANGTLRYSIVTLTLEKIEPAEEPEEPAEEPDPSPGSNSDKPSEEEKCVDGDTKIAEDGCNQCVCNNGEWVCTEVNCNPDNSDDLFLSAPSLVASVATMAFIALRRRY